MIAVPRSVLLKRLRATHSVTGLATSALLYLICLSGTLAVFFESFERWEQPDVPEYRGYGGAQIERSVNAFLKQFETLPDKLFVVLPSADLPRMHLSADGIERYVHADGTLAAAPAADWTQMLLELHNHLLLPETWGLLVTGSLGAMLCALVINGLLAHPNLLKDLFKLRRTGNAAMRHTDVHNRLGVWGSPFFLMFGLTGAFFGLVGVLAAAGAQLWYGGDREALIADIYGADVKIEDARSDIDFAAALTELHRAVPEAEAEPIYLMVQNPGTDRPLLEIAATLPGRLIYSEIYRFLPSGKLLGHQGLSDGPAGRQVAYSVYRIHFGHFGGYASKLLYGALGLALTVICASGVNIWLARRAQPNHLDLLWSGFVWGVPLALSLAALGALLSGSPEILFLSVLSGSIAGSLLWRDAAALRRSLQWTLLLSLGAVIVVHAWRFGLAPRNGAVAGVHGAILVVAAYLLWRCQRRRQSARLQPAPRRGPAAPDRKLSIPNDR